MRAVLSDISVGVNKMTLVVFSDFKRIEAFVLLLRTFLGRTKMLFVGTGKRFLHEDLPRAQSVRHCKSIFGNPCWLPFFGGIHGCLLNCDDGQKWVTVHPRTVLDALEASWKLSKLPAVGMVFDGQIEDRDEHEQGN